MGERVSETNGPGWQGEEIQFVGVPDERGETPARRAEVRLLLVRLLVDHYLERHRELVKNAA